MMRTGPSDPYHGISSSTKIGRVLLLHAEMLEALGAGTIGAMNDDAADALHAQQLADLEAASTAAIDQRNNIQSQLDTLLASEPAGSAAVANLQAQLDAANAEVAANDTELEDLQAEAANRESRLAALESVIDVPLFANSTVAPITNGQPRAATVLGSFTATTDGPQTFTFEGSVVSGTGGYLLTSDDVQFDVDVDLNGTQFTAIRNGAGVVYESPTANRITPANPTRTNSNTLIAGTTYTIVVFAGGGSTVDSALVTVGNPPEDLSGAITLLNSIVADLQLQVTGTDDALAALAESLAAELDSVQALVVPTVFDIQSIVPFDTTTVVNWNGLDSNSIQGGAFYVSDDPSSTTPLTELTVIPGEPKDIYIIGILAAGNNTGGVHYRVTNDGELEFERIAQMFLADTDFENLSYNDLTTSNNAVATFNAANQARLLTVRPSMVDMLKAAAITTNWGVRNAYEADITDIVFQWRDTNPSNGINPTLFYVTDAPDSTTPIHCLELEDGESQTVYIIGVLLGGDNSVAGAQLEITNTAGQLSAVVVAQMFSDEDDFSVLTFNELTETVGFSGVMTATHLARVFVADVEAFDTVVKARKGVGFSDFDDSHVVMVSAPDDIPEDYDILLPPTRPLPGQVLRRSLDPNAAPGQLEAVYPFGYEFQESKLIADQNGGIGANNIKFVAPLQCPPLVGGLYEITVDGGGAGNNITANFSGQVFYQLGNADRVATETHIVFEPKDSAGTGEGGSDQKVSLANSDSVVFAPGDEPLLEYGYFHETQISGIKGLRLTIKRVGDAP